MKIFVTCALFFIVLGINAQKKSVKVGVYHWEEIPVKINKDEESRTILKGASPHFKNLKIQAITKNKNVITSVIKSKKDEVLIIIKEGQARVIVDGKSTVLAAESVILVMPKQKYLIENIGNGNLSYYVLSYQSKKPVNISRGELNGGSTVFSAEDLVFKSSKRGGGIAYFDKPTAMCERFEMHITQLDNKGASHKPHTHIETEIILIISGNTEMMIDGKVFKGGVGDFYFVNSQLLHGISNATSEPCKYFAFKWN